MPIAIGTILIFSFFANNVRTAGPIAIGRGTNRCVSILRKMMVPIENHGARATCKGTFVVQQILLLKLQHTCIHYDFGPKAMLSNAGL